MKFIFDDEAGCERLVIRGENHKYLIKVRRHVVGDTLAFRNPAAMATLHTYTIASIDGRSAELHLLESRESVETAKKKLHIGWCNIDPKSVEKVLPMLNEIGVGKITFIGCERSQKSFRPDFKRYERLLLASMQQCGRSEMMQFDTAAALADFLANYPDTAVLDFCDTPLGGTAAFETVLIGCEGGFGAMERELLAGQPTFRLDVPMVLRSETAAVAIASKILL